MSTTLKIDFVSDVVCPWCAVGLGALRQAEQRLAGEVALDIRFQPFELNPDMPPEGESIDEHLARKYGASPEQMARTRDAITQRGAEVGFEFRMDLRSRTWNTFDAHRLLHWADVEGGQAAQATLKHALLVAYFTHGRNPGSHEVLLQAAQEAGLDVQRARTVLDSGEYADEVRSAEQQWLRAGIHSVPSIIINDRHLIQGGQSAEVFEQALRQIASQSASAQRQATQVR